MATDRQSGIRRAISERSARYFEAEVEKLDGWAGDLKVGLEREIKIASVAWLMHGIFRG